MYSFDYHVQMQITMPFNLDWLRIKYYLHASHLKIL